MCLGVPGRVVTVDGFMAEVDFWGVRRPIRLDIVDEPVSAGDWVLNHVGFAIRRIPPDQISATLELYDELLRLSDPGDLMAADVRGEIAATGAAPGPGTNGGAGPAGTP